MNELVGVITELSQSWFDFIYVNSLILSILSIVLFLVFKVIRFRPNIKYFLCFIVLLRALTPLDINLPFMDATVSQEVSALPTAILTAPVISTAPTENGFTILSYLFLFWFLVAAAYSFKLLLSEIVFKRKSRNIKGVNLDKIIQKIRYHLDYYDPVSCFISSEISFVYTTGLFKKKIILPKEALQWPEKELTGILAHEMTHQKRKDIYYQIIQMIIQILFFFHPAVWWLNCEINLEREKICDGNALKISGSTNKDYSKMLLTHLETLSLNNKAPLAASGFLFSKKSLTERFEYLLTFKESRMSKINKSGIFALTMVFIIVLGISFCSGSNDYKSQPEKQLEEKSDQAQNTMKDIKDNKKASSEEEEEFVKYDKPPIATVKNAPEYPQAARDAGIEGDVWLKVRLDTTGMVIPSKIKVLKNTTGDSGCVEAAIEAVKGYKFTPAYYQEKPVSVWVSMPFKFRLQRSPEKKDQ